MQAHAVLVPVIEQHAASPHELGLLRVRVADLSRIGQRRSGDAKIRELDERLARDEESVGLRRTHRVAEHGILEHELLQLPVLELVETGLLGVFAVGGQDDRPGNVDFLA